jgi:hypothetical protein
MNEAQMREHEREVSDGLMRRKDMFDHHRSASRTCQWCLSVRVFRGNARLCPICDSRNGGAPNGPR